MRTVPRVLVFSWIGALTACGGPSLQVGPTVPTLVQVGGAQVGAREIQDLDNVRDVWVGAEHVWVATDLGVVSYPREGDPVGTRLTHAQGLPSDDVAALCAGPEGSVWVGTSDGFARITADGAVRSGVAVAPVGVLHDAMTTASGALWACGAAGIAVFRDAAWIRFGEPLACRRLVPDGDAAFWVVGERAIWRVEGDIIREHGSAQVLPEGTPVDLVPLGDGYAIALLKVTAGFTLAHFDRQAWSAYTIDGLDMPIAGLVRAGQHTLLVGESQTFEITPTQAPNAVPLFAWPTENTHGPLSYRARLTPAGEIEAATAAPSAEDSDAPVTPVRMAPVPAELRSVEVEAPELFVFPSTRQTPGHAYGAWAAELSLFVSERNRGVIQVENGRRLTSMDAVAPADLQIASDRDGTTFFLGRDLALAVWDGAALVRVQPPHLQPPLAPEPVTPQAIATGPQGGYVAALGESSDGQPTLLMFRRAGEGWTSVFASSLDLPARPTRLPFLGVTDDETFWVGLRVVRADGGDSVARGVIVQENDPTPTVYHHFGATRETDGEGALSMPDEVSTVDLSQEGYAWFASLQGAVRVGNHQAVVFGEARGVRGEVVSDVAVGTQGRVWVAAAEGLGYYENQRFEFRLPAVAREARPTALAVDLNGRLWAAGPRGLIVSDGEQFSQVGSTTERMDGLVDVEVDNRGAVWLLAADRVIRLDAAH